jgi:hypothetical protein
MTNIARGDAFRALLGCQLRSSDGQPFHNPVGEGLPTIHPGIVSGVGIRLLTNPDLSSHAINQFLGIVADPGLEHRLDVLNLVNAL